MSETIQRWSRDFFRDVEQACRALEIEEQRRLNLFTLGKSGQATGHAGSIQDSTAKIDAYIDAQQQDGLDWARGELAAFDSLMLELRISCRGDVLVATWAAEYRYRIGLSIKETSTAMGLSSSKIKQLTHTLVDYLDHVGPGILDEQARSVLVR